MTDLESGFNKIALSSLMLHCDNIGLEDRMLHFIYNFLQNWKIDTEINSTISDIRKSTVLQGSVFSPTVYNLMFDLESQLPPIVNIISYAEDITI